MADPVLVVGAGPTGLTAALEFSRFGVPVRLVDKSDAPATTSRAIGVQARTRRTLPDGRRTLSIPSEPSSTRSGTPRDVLGSCSAPTRLPTSAL